MVHHSTLRAVLVRAARSARPLRRIIAPAVIDGPRGGIVSLGVESNRGNGLSIEPEVRPQATRVASTVPARLTEPAHA